MDKSLDPRPVGCRREFRELLGPTPNLAAGDTSGARMFLERIIRVKETGGWSKQARVKLAELKKIWRMRASGEDEYFNKWGNGCQVSERSRKKQEQEAAAKKQAQERVPELVDLADLVHDRKKLSEYVTKPRN